MNLATRAVLLASVLSFLGSVGHAANGVYPTHFKMWPQVHIMSNTSASSSNLVYYGGPVIANVKVYAVFWGSAVDSDLQKNIGGFYQAAVNSTYIDWMTEYNTSIAAVDGRQGTNQTIGRGSYLGEITISPSNGSKSLSDTDIQAEIESQVAKKVLPVPDDNTLFMVYFPSGVSISIEGGKSCQSFCAYHNGFKSQSLGNVFYGVMPDLGSGMCSLGCGTESDVFDSTTSVSSHELFEAITDPFPTPADKPTFPQAWNTTSGEEIGDLCASNDTQIATPGRTYVVQQLWDNATRRCAPGPYSMTSTTATPAPATPIPIVPAPTPATPTPTTPAPVAPTPVAPPPTTPQSPAPAPQPAPEPEPEEPELPMPDMARSL
jgi:hypothetical protein